MSSSPREQELRVENHEFFRKYTPTAPNARNKIPSRDFFASPIDCPQTTQCSNCRVRSGLQVRATFLLPWFAILTILALTSRGGMIMPFWTKFWVIVPPIVLLAITIIFYIVSGKKREG
jgi:hypothetical protein